MKKEIKNAIIQDTMLGFEDHGIFTCMIYLDYGGSVQGYGGYSLGGEFTNQVIKGILKALDVDIWESLKGVHVRVEKEGSYNGKILRIGHFLEEKWFSFK